MLEMVVDHDTETYHQRRHELIDQVTCVILETNHEIAECSRRLGALHHRRAMLLNLRRILHAWHLIAKQVVMRKNTFVDVVARPMLRRSMTF